MISPASDRRDVLGASLAHSCVRFFQGTRHSVRRFRALSVPPTTDPLVRRALHIQQSRYLVRDVAALVGTTAAKFTVNHLAVGPVPPLRHFALAGQEQSVWNELNVQCPNGLFVRPKVLQVWPARLRLVGQTSPFKSAVAIDGQEHDAVFEQMLLQHFRGRALLKLIQIALAATAAQRGSRIHRRELVLPHLCQPKVQDPHLALDQLAQFHAPSRV